MTVIGWVLETDRSAPGVVARAAGSCRIAAMNKPFGDTSWEAYELRRLRAEASCASLQRGPHIDSLPQRINVLRWDLRIVGTGQRRPDVAD
jgi:hypothetical protein